MPLGANDNNGLYASLAKREKQWNGEKTKLYLSHFRNSATRTNSPRDTYKKLNL